VKGRKSTGITLPMPITVFWATHADPKTQARRARCDLIYLHEVDKRGHLAAREQPNCLRPSSVLRSVQLKVWVTFVNPNS
jgi:hypothetical protein